MDNGGQQKVLNPETVKYELLVLVTEDDGESIEVLLRLEQYNWTRDFLVSRPFEFEDICGYKRGHSNNLSQFLPIEIIGDVKKLILTWDDSVMERFPLGICGFDDLQELKISSVHGGSSCCRLRHLPPEIGDLKSLRIFGISCCNHLEDLPSEIGNLENLEEFVISSCESLKHLSSDIGNLKRLRRLDISCCDKLEDLPSTIGNLESLEELSVETCRRLTHFPSEISNLQSLRNLNLSSMRNGMDNFLIPCTNLVNLQEMKIVYCESLVHLPQEIGNLRCLRKLWIENCNNLENLPPAIGNLESLQELITTGCPRINDLPPEIGNLRCLQKLEKTSKLLHDLYSIPLEVGNLLSLQELKITYRGCLERLALVINKLERHLQRLYIDYDSCFDPNHADHFGTSFTVSVRFRLKFTMTLVEVNFQAGFIRDTFFVNNFLQSLAAENSPLLPMSLFLPQGIRCIKFEDSILNKSKRKIFDKTICKLLQKYPRLGNFFSFPYKILYRFSADTLHLMYLNRFGRSLQYKASTSGDRSPLSLLAGNIWPIILEEAQTRIRKDLIGIAKRTTLKNPRAISASVIYSIVRELVLPLLVEH